MSVERTDDHRYFITSGTDRIEAVSTTRVIVESNLVNDAYFTDESRLRGKIVHSFVEQIATNTLNRPIDVAILGYLQALRSALDKEKPNVIGAEVVLGNLARLFAGTVDIEAIWKKFDAIYEVKTSGAEPWHALQTAAYAYLKAGPKWMKIKRFALYLRANGSARLIEHDDHRDLDYFFRALEMLQWRIERGTYERPYGRNRIDGGNGTGSVGSGFRDAGIAGLPIVDDEFRERRSVDDGDSPF